MTATTDKGGFSIGVGCPGCGGELELQENFFVLSCPHCGSCLRVVMPDVPAAFLVKGKLSQSEIRFHIDRFLKERHLPLTGSGLQVKNLYYPYWKIDGVQVRVRNRLERREVREATEYSDGQYVEQQLSDIGIAPFNVTVAAGARLDGVPVSIGLRAEYIKMFPYADEEIEESFDSLPVARSSDDALVNVASKFAAAGEAGFNTVGINKTELFDPVFSIIYFPYHVAESCDNHRYNRYVLDGVSGRVLHHTHPLHEKKLHDGHRPDIGFESQLQAEGFGWTDTLPGMVPDETRHEGDEETKPSEVQSLEFGALGVEFHRCPTCGEDLPDRQSHMYICRNCHEMVLLERSLVPVRGIARTAFDDRRGDKLFPFWSFTITEETGAPIKRLFAGIFGSDRIIIPAFRMPNFEATYRLARRISTAAPKLEFVPVEDVDSRFVPVDVGPNGALTTAHVVVYREMLSRDQNSSPEDVAFSPGEASLVYASFHPESYFYVDSILGAVTFEKSLV